MEQKREEQAGCTSVAPSGPESSFFGVSLRELLESKCFNAATKNDMLELFREIVKIVDIKHNQGIGLMDLRPSSFILYKTGDVKYIGSLVEARLWSLNQENTRKRELESSSSSHDNFPEKVQKIDANKSIMLTSNKAQLEKMWYTFPGEIKPKDLLASNIYSLGVLFFEILCQFNSIEARCAAMLDLQNQILPPYFISKNYKEAEFCFWLLHSDHSSRPTTREILKSELINGCGHVNSSNDEALCVDMEDDVQSVLLLDFLFKSKQHMERKACSLIQSLEIIDKDIKMVESSAKSLGMTTDPENFSSSSKMNVAGDRLLELENIYLSMRSKLLITEMPNMDRPDKDVLTHRERLSSVPDPPTSPSTEVNIFDGICKFASYDKFEVCMSLNLTSNNLIRSMSINRDEEYIATAFEKIRIFDFDLLLDDQVDVHYPILEMTSKSKFSCICWNAYIINYLVSTNYDGLVQMWDTNTGQQLIEYNEHQKIALSVDFSRVDPTSFASGGDDCSLKLWNIKERNSVCTISSRANICCVQFSPYSSQFVTFGCADSKIYCYDLRHTRIPWCTLSHDKAVSYVRFLDPESIVSSSIDSTLRLWDLKKTSLDGPSSNACSLTFKGHSNNKHFVGLDVLDGYIACGSETNEVYAYCRSLPIPILSHKFEDEDPLFRCKNSIDDSYFTSSVCWRSKSQMLAAGNSNGTMQILRMA